MAAARDLSPLDLYEIEVCEVTYAQWLIDGGPRLPEFEYSSWAKTTPMPLEVPHG